MRIILLVGWLICFFQATEAQQLVIYPVPKGMLYSRHNDDFTVKVRLPGKDWQDLFEYRVKVDLDNPQDASMVQFDFSGKVEIMVKVNNGNANDVKIRPGSKNIQFTKDHNIVRFSIDKPVKLSLEVNGDRLHNLHIFANAPETYIPDPKDPNVVYFGEGIHTPGDIPGNAFRILSGQTVYLAPGAVVRGKFVCDKVENVRFIGRGIIDEPERGFELTYCKNITIDGITIINPSHYTVYGGQSEGLKIKNMKSFSAKGWNDGIDLMACSNVTIDDVFLRNSDDCIAIYGQRWTFFGDVHDYKITNAILWADIAHPITIGSHGNAKNETNTIENIHISDIDILEHDEDENIYQGCMAINAGDHNLVQNVTFENIRVENIQEGQLFNVRVVFNDKYNAAAGKGIRNILFKNITYTGYGENPSLIEGYNEQAIVEDVKFENININGKRMTSLDDCNIRMGKFVKNVILK